MEREGGNYCKNTKITLIREFPPKETLGKDVYSCLIGQSMKIINIKIINLKLLLKLLSYENYRTKISQIKLNSKTTANQREQICRELKKNELVDYTEEIVKIKIASSGKALLKIDEAKDKLTEQELKILKACQDKNISPSQTKVTPIQTRQELLKKLRTQGLIDPQIKIKEVWLTDRGKEYLAKEYAPSSGGNITFSQKMLANYLHFLRGYLSVDKKSEVVTSKTKEKPNDSQIFQKIVDLDREHNTDNYLPIFHLRQRLQPPLSREELDEALYRLQASDKIDLSTLAEVEAYSPKEIEAGISQPVGGELFFITVN